MKIYGRDNSHLTLTEKAERFYAGADSIGIVEHENYDDNDERFYTYDLTFPGSVTTGLSADELNDLLENYAEEGHKDFLEDCEMQTNPFGMYSYQELLEKAMAPDAEQIDIDTLGEWFQTYGMTYWNGERFDIDGFHSIRPVQVYDYYDDCWITTGYEIR